MKLSRRHFLRGASGAALALPAFAELSHAATPVPRFIVWYWPEGVIEEAWWPTGAPSDASTKLPSSLAPLEAHRKDLTLVRGIEISRRGRIEVNHENAMAELLSGAQGGNPGNGEKPVVAGGRTIDQSIAEAISGTAAFKSYQLGVSNFAGSVMKRSISYSQKGAASPAEVNPVAAFDKLLSGVGGTDANRTARLTRLARRKSVLDSSLDALARLRCQLGRDGLVKLDAHLAGVRAAEETIDRLLAIKTDPQSAPTIDRAIANASRDVSKHAELGAAHQQILLASLRADVCRCFTMQWVNTGADNVSFGWLPLTYKNASYHGLSHEHAGTGPNVVEANKATTRTDRASVVAYWMKQLAGLVAQLKATTDGTGTLFDGTTILGASEYGGNQHKNTDIPFFLLGGGGGRFASGKLVDLRKGNAFRSHNDLLATVANAYDPRVTSYGDAAQFTALLPELRG